MWLKLSDCKRVCYNITQHAESNIIFVFVFRTASNSGTTDDYGYKSQDSGDPPPYHQSVGSSAEANQYHVEPMEVAPYSSKGQMPEYYKQTQYDTETAPPSSEYPKHGVDDPESNIRASSLPPLNPEQEEKERRKREKKEKKEKKKKKKSKRRREKEDEESSKQFQNPGYNGPGSETGDSANFEQNTEQRRLIKQHDLNIPARAKDSSSDIEDWGMASRSTNHTITTEL